MLSVAMVLLFSVMFSGSSCLVPYLAPIEPTYAVGLSHLVFNTGEGLDVALITMSDCCSELSKLSEILNSTL